MTLRRGDQTVEVTVRPEPITPSPGPEFSRYMTGIYMQPADAKGGVSIAGVMPYSAALAAGLKPGDRLLEVDGRKIASPAEFSETISKLKGTPFQLTYEREEKMHTVTLAARLISPHTIGVTISLLDHPTPIQQFVSTIDMSYKSLRGILVRLGNRLGLTEQTSTLKPSHMSGPLGMGLVLFNSVRSASLISGIYFVVVISFALAIFNLFPLPVLDGGHILFGLIEIVFRRPLPVVVVKVLSTIFVTLLISLMLYVTFFDGKRIYYSIFPERDDVPTATESAGEKTHVNPTPNQP